MSGMPGERGAVCDGFFFADALRQENFLTEMLAEGVVDASAMPLC